MSSIVKQFLTLSLGLIALLLILSHYTGAEGVANAIGGNLSGIYKTLQGR